MKPHKKMMILKILLLPNIMILTKWIILKRLMKINLSLFHKNACSLNKNFDNLQHLLSYTKIFFDIIAVTQTRIRKQVFLLHNLNLGKYSYEFNTTKMTFFFTLLIIYLMS